MTDFDLPELDREISERLGEPIDSFELKIRYVCPDCKATMNSAE